MNDPFRGSGRAQAAPSVVIGPDAGFIGVACIAVTTAAVLGVDWLRGPLLGVPSGLWLVAGGYALVRALRWRSVRSAVPAEGSAPGGAGTNAIEPGDAHGDLNSANSGQLVFPFPGSESGGLGPNGGSGGGKPLWQSGAMLAKVGYRLGSAQTSFPRPPGFGGRGLLNVAGAAAGGARLLRPETSTPPSALRQSLARWHDSGAWPVRPIRVGVDLSSDLAGLLVRLGGGLGIEWVPVAAGREDRRECTTRALDGVIRMDGAGDIRFCTAEHAAREAGWYDWARPMPLSYSAVFPTRVDPCIVTLARAWGFEAADTRLIARLVYTAAILSRSRYRLGLSDRLRGRRPFDLGDGDGLLIGAMSDLAEAVCTERSADAVPMKAAARVLGAWVATTDAPIDPELRREAAEASLRVLGEEPEAILRAVAARFATYDDAGAFAGILDAQRAIRAAESGPILDPVAFLEAEIGLGLPGPMTFGRVAAGLCLVCATAEDARIDYVCDDLVEEMRYAGWLIGRDADRRVLVEVMRTMQQARKSDAARKAA